MGGEAEQPGAELGPSARPLREGGEGGGQEPVPVPVLVPFPVPVGPQFRSEAPSSPGSFTVRPRALRRCCLWT